MKYAVTDAGVPDIRDLSGRDYWPARFVKVWREGQALYITRPLFERPYAWDVLSQAGIDHDREDEHPAMTTALLRYTIARVESELAFGVVPVDTYTDKPVTFDLGEEDVPELVRLLVGDRECHYQERDGRELVCHASTHDDPLSVKLADSLTYIAPTSAFLCKECSLPRDELLCSHLIRPEVRRFAAEKDEHGNVPFGAYRRSLRAAMCDLGRVEVQAPKECCIGGHSCAVRLIDEALMPSVVVLPPAAINDSLGYLDAVWRGAFGKGHGLVRSSVTAAGGLVLGCETSDDFRLRLIDLAEILNRLDVRGDLYSAEARADIKGRETPPRSLERVQLLLADQKQLPPEDAERGSAAVDVLRSVVAFRSTHAAHPGSPDAIGAAARLGLAYPPRSWGDAWDFIRSRTVTALNELRESVARLSA